MRWRHHLAEGTGTAVVVLLGTATAVAMEGPQYSGGALLAESVGFGLGLLVALLAVGEVSGRQFNPAVTLGAYFDGRLSLAELARSWLAQILGGIGAAAVLWAIAGQGSVDAAVTTTREPMRAFATEIILGAVFVAVALAATRYAPHRMDAMLMMALAYAGVHVAGLPFSGGSVNPARSVGPALVAGDASHLWVYVLGPLVGGVAGFALYRGLGLPAAPEEGSGRQTD